MDAGVLYVACFGVIKAFVHNSALCLARFVKCYNKIGFSSEQGSSHRGE